MSHKIYLQYMFIGLYVKKRFKEQEMGMLSLPSIPLLWFSSLHSVFGRRLRIRLIRLFCVIQRKGGEARIFSLFPLALL